METGLPKNRWTGRKYGWHRSANNDSGRSPENARIVQGTCEHGRFGKPRITESQPQGARRPNGAHKARRSCGVGGH